MSCSSAILFLLSVGVNRVYPISRCRGTREPPSLMWLKDRHNLYNRNPLFKVIYGRTGKQYSRRTTAKASNGIDAAVSFSQTQLPDVVHQLLLWNMVDSLIKTLIAILTIPLVFRFMKKQCQRVEIGKICDEGYSWERGNPKYRQTMVWDSKGEINFLILPLSGVLIMWGLLLLPQ